MKLFLTSDLKHPKALEDMIDHIPDIKNKKVAFIPTASNGKGYGAWKGREFFNVIKGINNNIEIAELENYFQQDILKIIRSSDIIIVQGGMAAYLLYFLRVTGFEREMNEILSHSIYVGSSGGAMVASRTQFASAFFIDEPEIGADLVPGLGLIDFEIYPHYKEEQHDQINALWKKGSLALLKDGESIIVENNDIKFTGSKREIIK